jgi:hypothetical protein
MWYWGHYDFASLVDATTYEPAPPKVLALFSVKVQVRPRQPLHLARAPVTLRQAERLMRQSQQVFYLIGYRAGHLWASTYLLGSTGWRSPFDATFLWDL